MISVKDKQYILQEIDAILNNGGIAEVKAEGKNKEIVVVEIRRTLKTPKSERQ